MLNKSSFGQTVTLTVIRDAQSIDVQVTFEKESEPVL
jgi:S1-C subfamily serine protease